MTALLVCAATDFELACFPESGGVLRAVTGVGIPATLSLLPPLLKEHRPALVLNIGIAGAYPGADLEIGELVLGESDLFGDIGFGLPDGGFDPIQSGRFGGFYQPLPLAPLPDGAEPLPVGRGCTVNACCGTRAVGEFRRDSFGARFETMEGAAVALACRDAEVSLIQIRAISNIAAERDMRLENIRLALDALSDYLRRNSAAF